MRQPGGVGQREYSCPLHQSMADTRASGMKAPLEDPAYNNTTSRREVFAVGSE